MVINGVASEYEFPKHQSKIILDETDYDAVANEVAISIKRAGYEYDDDMSIDNNIGSAMLGEYAKGYNKGYEDKCTRVKTQTVDEFVKVLLGNNTLKWGNAGTRILIDMAEKYKAGEYDKDLLEKSCGVPIIEFDDGFMS